MGKFKPKAGPPKRRTSGTRKKRKEAAGKFKSSLGLAPAQSLGGLDRWMKLSSVGAPPARASTGYQSPLRSGRPVRDQLPVGGAPAHISAPRGVYRDVVPLRAENYKKVQPAPGQVVVSRKAGRDEETSHRGALGPVPEEGGGGALSLYELARPVLYEYTRRLLELARADPDGVAGHLDQLVQELSSPAQPRDMTPMERGEALAYLLSDLLHPAPNEEPEPHPNEPLLAERQRLHLLAACYPWLDDTSSPIGGFFRHFRDAYQRTHPVPVSDGPFDYQLAIEHLLYTPCPNCDRFKHKLGALLKYVVPDDMAHLLPPRFRP